MDAGNEIRVAKQRVERVQRELRRSRDIILKQPQIAEPDQRREECLAIASDLREQLTEYRQQIHAYADMYNRSPPGDDVLSKVEFEESLEVHEDFVAEIRLFVCRLNATANALRAEEEKTSVRSTPQPSENGDQGVGRPRRRSPSLSSDVSLRTVMTDKTPGIFDVDGAVAAQPVLVATNGGGTSGSVSLAQGAHAVNAAHGNPYPSGQAVHLPVPLPQMQTGYPSLQYTTVPQPSQHRYVPQQTPAAMSGPQMGPPQQSLRNDVKLPKLNLTSFSGDYTKFRAFMSRFHHAVGSRMDYSKSTKLSYLTEALKGNPRSLIEGMELSEENYDKAMKILVDTYGDPSVAIEDLENQFYRMEQPSCDSECLRSFYCKMERILGSLNGLGCDTSSHHLVGMLLGKLPRPVISSLEHHKPRGVSWTVDLLRGMLKEEVEVREATDRRCGKQKLETEPRTESKYAPFGTANALAVADQKAKVALPPAVVQRARVPNTGPRESGQSQQAWTGMRSCRYCGEHGHFHEDCQKHRTRVERQSRLNDLKLCFNCLGSKHVARNCKRQRTCIHCQRSGHHRSICPERFGSGRARGQAGAGADASHEAYHIQSSRGSGQQVQESASLADDECTVLKTAMVNIASTQNGSWEQVRAFLDSGCSRSFITDGLAKRLRLKTRSQRTLAVNRFGGDGTSHYVQVKTADVTLRNRNGKQFNVAVSVTPSIMNQLTRVAVSKEILNGLPADICLADEVPVRNRLVAIDFLIGNDYYDDFVNGSKIDLTSGLKLISSEFGWILSGRVSDEPYGSNATALYAQDFNSSVNIDDVVVESKDEYPDLFKGSQIEDLWSLESIGIKENPNPASDDSALEQFYKTVKFENGRYMVTWPWQANADDLPSNYGGALERLKKTVARVKRTPGLIERYDGVIKDQLEKSVIEEVLNEETPNRVHYLPHREVLTPQKETTKLRVVYDASAKASFGQPSLNDCLYRGLVFMTALVTLLMRFMLYPIAVISDIEKAFLQVGLQEQERDVTRFLWLRDVTKAVTPDNLVIYRFARVAFGMRSSPFLLGATIAYHLWQSKLEIARLIGQNIYTDNIITGFSSEAEAIRFYHDSKQLFQEAGMNLREFASNSGKVMGEIPENDRAAKPVTKVLGIGWNRERDEMFLHVPDKFPVAVTARDVMQGLLKVYDPLGFVSPIVIRSRILLQKICGRKSKNMKEKVEQSVIDGYKAVIEDYAKLRSFKWPRYGGHELDDSCRLTCFCDASQDAYATVLYLQHKLGNGNWSSRIIFSKARVSPIKSRMTIPRLELLAVLIGVRAVNFIRQQLSFGGRVILWSDSQCVLKWIGSQKVLGTFVENRLKEIRKASGIEYRFVKTDQNPADLPSRGASFDQLSEFWWNGPEWSKRDDSFWPEFSNGGQADSDMDSAEGLPEGAVDTCTPAVVAKKEPFGLKLEDSSSYDKLIRKTAWAQRFVDLSKGKTHNRQQYLLLAELRDAEILWLRHVQDTAYSDLRTAIASGKRQPLIDQLGTVIEGDGLIRCKGRFGKSSEAHDKACPILIPTGRFADLLIEKYHQTCLHAGKKATLSAMRYKYWIVKGPSSVQKVLHRCVKCRRAKANGYARPEMPDLPFYRVNQHRPFQFTGLDYMGPLHVRDKGSVTKVWVSLFTCLTTRAVHLELVGSLSANDFIMALRRFVSRRGKPQMILCDNASQFVATSRNDLVSKSLQGESIDWRFITPLSPWKGGVYERLVALVKSALRKSIGRAMLSKEQLVTLLTEVEYTLNSRPVTALQDDPSDQQALTPNDLLGVVNIGDEHDEVENPRDHSYNESQQSLSSLYRKTRNILGQFWKVWRSDYLALLRERHRRIHKDSKGSVKGQPEVGDVVILKDESMPRNQWKLAIVVKVNPSPDGATRSATVKLPSGCQLLRPVTLLCPLEVKARDHSATVNSRGDKDDQESARPKRLAAKEAQSKIKLIFDDVPDDVDEDDSV